MTRDARACALSISTFLLCAACIVAPSQARGEPSEEDAQGRCESPQQALYTALYWLQPDHYDPARAAACLDRSRLDRPGGDGPRIAEKLKKVLDGRSLYVLWEDIPADADYKDSSGSPRFELYPADLGGIAVVRTGKRWQFTPASLDRIQALYRESVPAGFDDFLQGLPEWLRGRVLGLQAWQLLGVLLLAFLALAIQKLAVLLVGTYLRRLLGRLAWVKRIVQRADRPLGGLVMAGVFAAGLPLLQFPVRAHSIMALAVRVLAAYSVVWLGYRLIDVLCEALAERAAKTTTKLDDQLVPLLRKTLKLFLAVVGGIFILQNLNVDVGSLLAGLGLGGLAFALAAKDTVANFFGSVMIFIDKPFHIGDWVKLSDSIEGTVEEVGFRTTRIRTFYNSVVTVPNAVMTNTSIDNLGARRYRRFKTTLGLTYDTPPEKVQAFCEGVRAIIQTLPGMRRDFFLVEFHDFGPHSLDVLLYCFMDTPDWASELRVRTNLNLEIMRLAHTLGVSFAFPTQTLHVESMPRAQEEGASAPGAVDIRRLAEVVRSFGPGGRLALPRGFQITDEGNDRPIAIRQGSAE